MGNRTTSVPSPGGFGNQTAGAASFRGSGTLSMPEDGWVDLLHMYLGGNGGTQNFNFLVYRTSDGALVANAGPGAFGAKGWKALQFSLNSGNNNNGYPSPNLWLPSGYGFLVAAYCDGPADFGINNGFGSWSWHSGVGVQSSYNGWTTNPFGNFGEMYWYVEYWKPCSVTSITSGVVAPGQTFDVFGISFNSGITNVQVNGVNCSGVNVLSDTHLQATVPAGTGGQVQVLSNAGASTSSASLLVSAGKAADGSAYQACQFYVADGSTYQQALEVRVADGSAYQLVSG